MCHSRPQPSQRLLFEAGRVTFTRLRNLDHFLCDEYRQRVRSIGHVQVTQRVFERRDYDFDFVWTKCVIPQCPVDRHPDDSIAGFCEGREPKAFPIIAIPLCGR
jgi:hypothetical protein